MFRATILKQVLSRLLILPLALGLAGCDNPVEHEEHPEGIRIRSAQGVEVARYVVNVGQTGQIALGVGADQTFTVEAISEDGDAIEIDGDELSIRVVAPPQGLSATVVSENNLVLGASAPGTYELTIELWHGGHEEFPAQFTVVAQ